MKRFFTIILLIIGLNTGAQTPVKFITANDATVYSLTFFAGVAEGVKDALTFHFTTGVMKTIPNIDQQFWNPKVSWVNKNKNGFTKTFPIFSDGWHLTNGISHIANIAAIAVSASDFKGHNKWMLILKKLALSFAANRLGFFFTYNVLFRDRVN